MQLVLAMKGSPKRVPTIPKKEQINLVDTMPIKTMSEDNAR